jgi:hypothetical protein
MISKYDLVHMVKICFFTTYAIFHEYLFQDIVEGVTWIRIAFLKICLLIAMTQVCFYCQDIAEKGEIFLES